MNTTFSRYKRRFSALALTSALLSLTVSTTASAQGLPAEVITASKQNVPTYIEAVGTLKANESLILRPEITGRIDTIASKKATLSKRILPLFSLMPLCIVHRLTKQKLALN